MNYLQMKVSGIRHQVLVSSSDPRAFWRSIVVLDRNAPVARYDPTVLFLKPETCSLMCYRLR
jgi:hypothetical protein